MIDQLAIICGKAGPALPAYREVPFAYSTEGHEKDSASQPQKMQGPEHCLVSKKMGKVISFINYDFISKSISIQE